MPFEISKIMKNPHPDELTQAIGAADFSGSSVTVVGFGNMGRKYVAALQVLGMKQIRVCSRREESLVPLRQVLGVTLFPGGYRNLAVQPAKGDLAIVAVPILDLMPATKHLRELGFRKFLIEKPISLWSDTLGEFAKDFKKEDVDAVAAFNRVAYPVLYKVEALAREEGGITSCTYTFTELTQKMKSTDYPRDVMQRWGVANSLHVISMAHRLIGLPKEWQCHREGNAVSWHPTGSVFVGSGISQKNIPFTYHADWGSTGRWSVEIHTKVSSYRLSPLEKLYRRMSFNGEWKEIAISIFAPDVKMGFAEQVAAMLEPELRKKIPLVSLSEACQLTRFAEDIFGYERGKSDV